MIKLIEGLLKKKPQERPSHEYILNHSIFQKLNQYNDSASKQDNEINLRLEKVKKELKLSDIEKQLLG